MQTPSRFQCLLIGSESVLVQCAEVALDRGHALSAVVSGSDPIASWCRERGVRRLDPAARIAESLGDARPDLVVAISYPEPLPRVLRELPRRAAVRFLEAPADAWDGAALPAWGLLEGAERWAVSWLLEPETRDEPRRILLAREFDLAPDETALTLNTRCFEQAIDSFGELLAGLEAGSLEPRAAAAAPRRRDAGERPLALGLLDFARSADDLARGARALDHGRYANALAVPKLLVGDRVLLAPSVACGEAAGAAAGSVLGSEGGGLRVATSDGEVRLDGLASAEGHALSPDAVASLSGRLASPDASLAGAIDAIAARCARHEAFWERRLGRMAPIEFPLALSAARGGNDRERREIALPGGACVAEVAAGFAAWLHRLGNRERFHLDHRGPGQSGCEGIVADVFAAHVPLEIEASRATPFALFAARVDAELRRVERRGSFALDLFARAPTLREIGSGASWRAPRLPIALEIGDDVDAAAARCAHPVALVVAPDASRACVVADPQQLDPRALDRFAGQLAALLEAALRDPSLALGALPLVSLAERHHLVEEWNATDLEHDRSRCVHEWIEERVRRAPDATALVSGERTLDYAGLDRDAERLARRLRALGVRPDALVGLFLEHSIELVVGALGIWKAGGAYVPLDPGFPAERIEHMIADSRARVIVTETRLLPRIPRHDAHIVCIDQLGPDDEHAVDSPAATPENLAYAIYTSGSTGRPKGVLVEHRNVVNFFRGMDQRIPHDPPGTWLAVTSPSFDISVLELFWTLARGFRVVLQPEIGSSVGGRRLEHADRHIDMSLFFFASDESAGSGEKYRLLLEAARFADRSGFSAVWTPERHFHAFGGLYPNPAVTGAAIAAITERVRIRAGSCVLPLHPPIRVAEEWAVVDNLSGGRVDISVASGWQPNDFALRPENFANAKQVMLDGIETVRALWRGESVEHEGPKGPVQVRTLPRPVQPELPVWITTAGNVETWRAAAERGCNILTHLLGQTPDEVAEKIEIYRKAWEQAGHAGRGHVTLMLHTFVSDDEQVVLEHAKGPMKEYLRSSIGLIKEAAWSFPAFKARLDRDGASPDEIFEGGLSDEEMDALLEHSFHRYYGTGSLLGTPEQCIELVDKLKGIDVDEIACQIDFGIDEDAVLESLPHLKRVMAESQPKAGSVTESVGELCRRHQVTHLQCTPSAAQTFLLTEEREGLAGIQVILIGGEAFPTSLAPDLAGLGGARVLNMYGPTETTIWSAVHEVTDPRAGESIPLGTPIANTRLYVVDPELELLPQAVPGELLIGGEGVTRGYHERPELTADRFVPDPFRPDSGERVYRTGDLVRWREDGALEFLGRIDHQVKVRGYRIELGEIESLLLESDALREAVAVAREDVPGDVRLVAYVVAAAGASPDADALREGLRARLPDYMVPSQVVVLERFPLTPNAKVDRKALPAPERARRRAAPGADAGAAPESELQRQLAGIWAEALGLDEVGLDDNFFDLGGHSLLAVQVHRRIRGEVERPLSITDLFRLPTLRALSDFLAAGDDGGAKVAESAEARAEARRKARGRRRPRGGR